MVQAQPEIIMILDYQDQPAEEKIAFLESLPALQSTPAVLHDLNLAAASCDRLGVLNHGELVAVGAPWDVLTADLVARVFGVAATVVPHPLTGVPQLLYALPPPTPARAGSAGQTEGTTP